MISNLKRLSVYASIAVVASTATLLAIRARAAGIPAAAALTYTGYLENPDGTPITGKKSIGLSFYDAATDGTEVCVQKPADIEPVAGRFQIALPNKCAAAVQANPDLWVEIEVEGALLGRTKLGAVPYAIEAGRASDAGGALDMRIATIEKALKTFAAKGDVPIVTAWQAYTPVLTRDGGTAVNNVACTGRYRRVGDSVEVAISTVFSGVPTTGGSWYQWSLPNDVSVEATTAGVIGSGIAEKGVGNNVVLSVYLRSAKGVSLTANGAGVYYVNDTVPFAMDATSSLSFAFTVPIVGWTATGP